MKKLLVGLLVVSLVLWTVSFALAAGFSDTQGTRYEDATSLLAALGLLTGFPDGTFRPGATITRAQFCAVAVRACGLEGAARQAAGTTRFPDVPSTHWASGYINVAVDQSICRGFPDGTFRPEAPVTYSEALAMLIRVLGYEPAVTGTWPTNYLVKAFELGVSDGVSFTAGAQATRGDVALFVGNCLDIKLMERVVVGEQPQFVVVDETLLDSRLGYQAVTGWVEETGDVLGSSLAGDEAVIGGDTYHQGSVDLTSLLGLEVKAWLDGDTVVLAAQLTPEDDIHHDRIADVSAGKVTLEELDEQYEVDPGAIVYWNLVRKDAGDIVPAWELGDVMVVLNDEDEIVTLLVFKYQGSAVVANVDYDDGEAWLLKGTATQQKYELADYDEVLILKDGVETDFDGVRQWDVAHYAEFATGAGDALLLDVVDEKVEGELEEIWLDEGVVVTVDGEEYVAGEDTTCSKDDNESFDEFDEATAGDFVGQEVTVYLDKRGGARHIVASLGEAAGEAEVGVVLWVSSLEYWYKWGPPGDERYYVKLLTPDGEKSTYEWNDDTHFKALDVYNDGPVAYDTAAMTTNLAQLKSELGAGTVVSFSLTPGGLLEAVEELHFEEPGWNMAEGDIDATNNVIDRSGTKYKVTGGTAIFDDYDGHETVYDWDTFEVVDIDDDDIWSRMYRNGDSTIDVLVVDSDGEDLSFGGEAGAGVVLQRLVTGDGPALRLLVGAEVQQYLRGSVTLWTLGADNHRDDTSVWSDLGIGDLVKFEVDSATEEFTELQEWKSKFSWDADGDLANEIFDYAWINEGGIDPDNLIVNVRCAEDKDEYDSDDLDILLTEDTVIYDVTGTTPELAGFDDLEEDQCIQFFDIEHDGFVDYVKITTATL